MRILTSVGVVFLLLAGTFTYFVATKGFDYRQRQSDWPSDQRVGRRRMGLQRIWKSGNQYRNAKSAEREWMPKRRWPKDAMALLKEMQMFGYGSMTDNFYIVVSTTYVQIGNQNRPRPKPWKDRESARNTGRNEYFSEDKKNSIPHQGIAGVKAYGTLTMIDKIKKESKKMYYEILLFGQQNGLQQVLIMHEEGDKYAKQITERIMKSVELKTVTE